MELVLYKIHYVGKPETLKQENMNGKCCICNGRKNIYCMQVQSSTLSQVTQNKRTFRICHMVCVFCKIKYMGKSEKQKKEENTNGKCRTCGGRKIICCKHVQGTTSFTSCKDKKNLKLT